MRACMHFCCLIQVTNAQRAGAVAAVVYDNVYEGLIVMSEPPGHIDPVIPSVFIDQHSGFVLSKLLEVEESLQIRIMPVSRQALIFESSNQTQ